jgi:stearoyl-CoA desaturase (delta-9 desaturase)
LFLILCITLVSTKGLDLSFDIQRFDLFFPLLAIILCGLPSSVLHNCAHRNVGPRVVNDLVGEFLGTVMLYGYRGFSLGHMFHHKYPDNPEFDPHPPRGYSFLRFVVSPVKATLVIIERAYFKEFGENEKSKKNIFLQKLFFNTSILLKVVFWLLVFGLKYFTLFYMVVYVANIFVFAHINYATHVEDESGSSEIINLNNNLYYKFVNLVSFGGYFHKSHHLRPRVFNPSKVELTEKRLKTFTPKEIVKTPDRKKLLELSFLKGISYE